LWFSQYCRIRLNTLQWVSKFTASSRHTSNLPIFLVGYCGAITFELKVLMKNFFPWSKQSISSRGVLCFLTLCKRLPICMMVSNSRVYPIAATFTSLILFLACYKFRNFYSFRSWNFSFSLLEWPSVKSSGKQLNFLQFQKEIFKSLIQKISEIMKLWRNGFEILKREKTYIL